MPLPSHPLAWTTTAFVFWDDINPAVLTRSSSRRCSTGCTGAGSSSSAAPARSTSSRASLPRPYLPGEAAETIKLEQAAFDELNAIFSLHAIRPRRPAASNQGRSPAQDQHPARAADGRRRLKLHPAARESTGTGGLVVERRVGGGRIVVTRFPLTDVRIKQWKNFDGFFNAVLLRRPAREFDDQNAAGLPARAVE